MNIVINTGQDWKTPKISEEDHTLLLMLSTVRKFPLKYVEVLEMEITSITSDYYINDAIYMSECKHKIVQFVLNLEVWIYFRRR